MELRLAINRYVRQNCRWEMGDTFVMQLHPNTKLAICIASLPIYT